jgi:hypothetical protein
METMPGVTEVSTKRPLLQFTVSKLLATTDRLPILADFISLMFLALQTLGVGQAGN